MDKVHERVKYKNEKAVNDALPCEKCGKMRIDMGELVCPYCNKFTILNDNIAQEIANKRLEIIKKIWKNRIMDVDKTELLIHVFEKREHETFKFFDSLYSMDLVGMLAMCQLLQEIMKMKNMNETGLKEPVQSKILDIYGHVIDEKRHCHHIKSDLEKMLYYKKYQRDCMTEQELLEGFGLFYTEEYAMLEKNYKKYNIVTEGKDGGLVKRYREEIEEIKKHPINLESYTPEERVKEAYDIICSLYIGLLQDDVFRDSFNLERYKEIITDPNQFGEFVRSTFDGKKECSEAKFLRNACNIFGKDSEMLKKLLLFEESNPDVFPCFMKITIDSKNIVLIDHNLCTIIYFILHAIIVKKAFDEETAKRGKEFENKPGELFKKYGFKYFKNKGIKNKMEIDGIAVDDNYCFIIEVKGKMIPILFMDQKTREKLIRDGKGVVDGYEYTGKVKREKPSLIKKIEYVKQNCKKFEIPDRNKVKFQGIVVSRFYQWILKHNGVKFMTDEELEECLLKNDLSAMTCDEKISESIQIKNT